MAWKNRSSATADSALLETSQYTVILNFKRDRYIYLSVRTGRTHLNLVKSQQPVSATCYDPNQTIIYHTIIEHKQCPLPGIMRCRVTAHHNPRMVHFPKFELFGLESRPDCTAPNLGQFVYMIASSAQYKENHIHMSFLQS